MKLKQITIFSLATIILELVTRIITKIPLIIDWCGKQFVGFFSSLVETIYRIYELTKGNIKIFLLISILSMSWDATMAVLSLAGLGKSIFGFTFYTTNNQRWYCMVTFIMQGFIAMPRIIVALCMLVDKIRNPEGSLAKRGLFTIFFVITSVLELAIIGLEVIYYFISTEEFKEFLLYCISALSAVRLIVVSSLFISIGIDGIMSKISEEYDLNETNIMVITLFIAGLETMAFMVIMFYKYYATEQHESYSYENSLIYISYAIGVLRWGTFLYIIRYLYYSYDGFLRVPAIMVVSLNAITEGIVIDLLLVEYICRFLQFIDGVKYIKDVFEYIGWNFDNIFNTTIHSDLRKLKLWILEYLIPIRTPFSVLGFAYACFRLQSENLTREKE